ncbi:MAG: hypothetical protein ACO3F2_09125 [Roseiflexaceae bacterium]
MTHHAYRGLALLYLFWAIALCSRAIWQYMSRNGDLTPTHLSLFAGIIYLAIVVWAWYGQRQLLIIGLVIELIGVISISIIEYFWPLPYASAWSGFGAGYVFMPIILPILGLIHLHRGPSP